MTTIDGLPSAEHIARAKPLRARQSRSPRTPSPDPREQTC
jgi:hypothetical protein